MTDSDRPAHGAYGLRVAGLDGAEPLLVRCGDDWPLLTVHWIEEPQLDADVPEPTESTVTFRDGSAVVDHGGVGTIEVQREPAVATFRIRATRDPHALVHPYLGGAASIVSRWLGREAFHAGAFVHGNAVWIVAGERTAGKSSLLAWLHGQGIAIMADDVVVVERGHAFAAPRSLDLRRESADALGLGEALGRVGARDRWRIRLPAAPLSLPVGGFVFLRWAEEDGIAPVVGHRRLGGVMGALTLPGQPTSAAALLELAALPCVELRRRRDWASLGGSTARLLAALDRHARPA